MVKGGQGGEKGCEGGWILGCRVSLGDFGGFWIVNFGSEGVIFEV